jgi:hypothetical protein
MSISEDILNIGDEEATIDAATLYSQLKAENSSPKYSEKDVEAFLKLLNSEDFSHDEKDVTIRDYLSEGLDINNKLYENISPLGISEFDKELNSALKIEYNDTE